ncbi:MAG: serine/threonine-protein kinase [Acidobacteriota bacterium]
MITGTGDEVRVVDETRRLLQARLKLAATALFTLGILFFVRDLLLGFQTGERSIGIGQLVLVGGAMVALYSGRALTLKRLRLIELLVFGVTGFRMVYLSYWAILEAARASDAAGVVEQMLGTTLGFFALIAFYGMFVPNTVRRASVIIGSFGVVFILMLPVMSYHDPVAWRFIWQAVDIEQRSTMVLMVIFAVGISITASSIIDTLRGEVIEARQMGQYRLTDLIGKGGMGEVWKAEHALLARPAAIKLIRPEVLDPDDPEKAVSMIRRFEREAQNTANLRSAHTVELYDFGITESGTLYCVMELLDGIDLDTLVNRDGPLPPARVRYLVRQVCDSLQEAHDAGLVHRDIKPANILACRMGGSYDFVKVLDFGLAKHHEAADAAQQDAKLTREGMIIGTPAYMPPETVTRGVSDVRSDIYALGCVMFWLLTGKLVFEGSAPMSMVVRHAQEPPPKPSQMGDHGIPGCLDRIVLACLAKQPDERPQSAVEVRRMLDECVLEDSWSDADARAWWESRPTA